MHDIDKTEEYWQDIFDTIDMDFLPVEYLSSLQVEFESGEKWEIDLRQTKDPEKTKDADVLSDFFDTYRDTIVSVDFRIHLDAVKKDVSKRTKQFLKFNK